MTAAVIVFEVMLALVILIAVRAFLLAARGEAVEQRSGDSEGSG
jgi:hypothetical protein